MKKLVFGILLLLLTTFTVVAQNTDMNKIKALKTAFISNALELTPDEAEKFWPIYNAYDKKIHQVRAVKGQQLARKIRLSGGVDTLSDIEADAVLQEFIAIDFNVATEKKKLQNNLKGIISSKKIIKLFWAEQNFNKELLKQLRDKRKANSLRRN